MNIIDLVQRYENNRTHYKSSNYNETLLRNEFLDPLFELLGWDIRNIKGNSTNEREVILEESIRADISENTKKPDYTFRLYSERKFFLEAKKPSVSIENNNETAKQVRRYGYTAKLKVSVISNFEYLMIYDTSIKVDSLDLYNKALIKTYHYTQYVEKFEELKLLLGRDSVYNGDFDVEWKDIESRLEQNSVDKLFLSQINSWRILLGTEIYNHNSAIPEYRLNDVVQSYINRIIFLRVCEDRNIEEYKTLLTLADSTDYARLIQKFKHADRKYNSGLFEQLLSNVIIENVSSAFWDIIHQLYYPESPYSFSVFSSDILGRIYEIFLSEKLTIDNSNIILVKKPENLDRDVVTTPTFIISNILKDTVLAKCNDLAPEEIYQLQVADISCGSGAFLLETFQFLNDIIVDYYISNDPQRLIKIGINSYKLSYSEKKRLLISCVFGVDKDFNAVEATKFGLLLKLLEGETNLTISETTHVLPDLSNNIFCGNSLISHASDSDVNPFDFEERRFDIIIGNPPYMKSEDMKNITPRELPTYKSEYESAHKQFDKYFLFIERGLKLLKDNGVLGYIVPSKFAKVGAGVKLRELIQKEKHLLSILSFGANQVFEDKTTYTCLLMLSKFPNDSFSYAEVKDINAWKNRLSEIEFSSIDTSTLNNQSWLLVPNYLSDVYNSIITQSIQLNSIVGEDGIFNGIQTSANSIYIFTPINEDDDNYYFEKNGETYSIEKLFTRPYFQTSRGDDGLNTYRTFTPNSRVIYPYENVDGRVMLIPLETIQENYPLAFSYLCAHKGQLEERDIKPTPETDNEWYRYGRHQSLESCSIAEKIIVGVLSAGDKYAVDTHGTLISSGGTAGYCIIANPLTTQYSSHYLQAILNSKYVEWVSSLYGEVFRGGYIARGTKVLERLPIRAIDFENVEDVRLHNDIANKQRELIRIHDQIDASRSDIRNRTILERKFKIKYSELQSLLIRLYDLDDQDKLIPQIKELYGTN